MPTIPKADSYGALLINAKGEILLREPTGHFGGYAWTFAKGRPDKGESPEETALREALEETGYRAQILGALPQVFAGTTATSAFFLAGPLGAQGPTDAETSATRWVSFDAAAALIGQTPSKTGRKRDLAILEAARTAAETLPPRRTCREDWQVQDMPKACMTLPLDRQFSPADMARIEMGYLPWEMEDKWFAWFDAGTLHLHRSWTGICIYQVQFRGDQAVSVTVNGDPEDYQSGEDEAAAVLALINDLFRLTGPLSWTEARKLVSDIALLGRDYGTFVTNFNAIWDTVWSTAEEMAEGKLLLAPPESQSPRHIGLVLLKVFGIPTEPLFEDDLTYPLSEAFMALVLQVRDLKRDCARAGQDWEAAAPIVEELIDWMTCLLTDNPKAWAIAHHLQEFDWDRRQGVSR